jgi:hypothetical protein
VGRGESPGVRTSIEGWGATMEDESRTCVWLAASSLRNGGIFLR